MDRTQASELIWHKSSYSSGANGSCVEVAKVPGGGRAVRHSKKPDEAIIEYTAEEWTAFLAGVRDGEFD
ncbi:DUF397 domain-containing protein [Nonomuraea sp. NPDC049646]|uniref:DUF397 domain-containing protein n=1 Tax=unclassified Nonomuraea TaxID=2593643 RepID=UPI0037B4B6E3